MFWTVLLILLAAGALWFWMSRSGQSSVSEYITETSQITDIVVTVTATGTIEPTNKVEISSELSGTIRSVKADFNDQVKTGQVLATLDTEKLEATVEHRKAALAASRAKIDEVKATLTEASAAYQRAVKLEERALASNESLQAAKAAFDRAQASLKSVEADVRIAEADLKLEETNLAKACICSSIDGVVLDRNVEVGQIVASSLQAPVLFTLAEDLRKMELQVDVDEADIGKVKVGNKAEFTVEAYQGRTFPAQISQLRYASETIDGIVTYKAILSIDNSELLLRPGMTATAEITVAEINDTLTVPNAALRFSPPAVNEKQSGEGSGLLGLVFRRPSSAATSSRNPPAGGRKTIWLLRDGSAVPVDVLTGETDGQLTQIIDGELTANAAVIIDMTDARQ
ncbi:MAG: efflux RND transporter periplasmic adaptor subunit [Gammaproteobacteria bacterium]|nr:efflux RND transporter periplasmic adaptor subunit [Gammaproteobacteria bacterium]